MRRPIENRARYLCNGENKNCEKITCYKNGGDCKHTKDIQYAKRFHQKCTGSSFWEEETADDVEVPPSNLKERKEVEGMECFKSSEDKTVRKSMWYRGNGIIGGERFEIEVNATGKYAEMLLKIADENIEKIFKDAEKALDEMELQEISGKICTNTKNEGKEFADA